MGSECQEKFELQLQHRGEACKAGARPWRGFFRKDIPAAELRMGRSQEHRGQTEKAGVPHTGEVTGPEQSHPRQRHAADKGRGSG